LRRGENYYVVLPCRLNAETDIKKEIIALNIETRKVSARCNRNTDILQSRIT
jgi:hypothetical protein